MIGTVKYLAEVTPHFAWVLALPLACVVVQLLFLRAALRARRRALELEDAARAGDFSGATAAAVPSRWPSVLVALSVLAIPEVAAWSITTARGLCVNARDLPSSEAAAMFSSGIDGMLNVVPWSINLFVPCVLLASFSLSLQVSTRRRLLRLRAACALAAADPQAALAALAARWPSADDIAAIPFLFLGLGFFPVLSGAWAHAIRLVQGYAGITDLPAEEKGPAVLVALDEAHALFVARAWLAYPGVALAVLVSVLLLARWRQPAPSQEPGPVLSWRATLAWAGLCLALALALFRLAAPFRAENRLPWPGARLVGDLLRVDQPDGPRLEGPDEIRRSPILQLSRGGAWLDGRPVAVEEFGDALRITRQTYRLLRPGERYAGVFLVLAASDTPTGILAAYLTAAAEAGTAHPLFTFTRRESQDRPMLGPLTRVLASAASATVLIEGEEPAEGTVLVRASDHARYGELARRLVELRLAGEDVALAM
jgi:hypothetical protein